MIRKLLLLALLPLTVVADSVSFRIENDTLGIPDNKDSEYTHGTQVTYMLDDSLLFFDNYGFAIQQNMYGPKLDNTDNMVYGEHPYCGYLNFMFIGEQWLDLDWSVLSIEHRFGLGGVGEHSYAGQTQKYIHKILGCKDPKGWKKWQVRDEFIAQYDVYANLNIEVFEENGFNTFIIPYAGIDAGGFKDMTAIGIDLKLGYDAPRNIGSGKMLSAPKIDNKFKSYFLVGVEGRYVAHDTAIEGGFFKDSPYTLDARHAVGEFHYGVGVSFDNVSIEFSQYIRSKEYDTNYRKPKYGAITLSVRF